MRDQIPSALSLPKDDRELILEGVIWVLLHAPTQALLVESLTRFCAPFTARLTQIASELALESQGSSYLHSRHFNTKTEAAEILGVLGTLYKFAAKTSASAEGIYQLFSQHWLLICTFRSEFESDQPIAEKTLRILSNVMRKCRGLFTPHLPEVLTLLTEGFSRQHFSSYLFTAENLISVYREAGQNDLLRQLFKSLTQSVLRSFNSPEAIKRNADITEDFFGMIYMYLESRLALEDEELDGILQYARLAIGTKETVAAVRLYETLRRLLVYPDVFSFSYNKHIAQKLRTWFTEAGPLIIRDLVSAVPGRVFKQLAKLIKTVHSLFQDAWLLAAINDVPDYYLTQIEKREVAQDIASLRVLKKCLAKLDRRAQRRSKHFSQ
jgi:hypothetical protein